MFQTSNTPLRDSLGITPNSPSAPNIEPKYTPRRTPNSAEFFSELASGTSLTPSSLVFENTWMPAVPPISTLARASVGKASIAIAAAGALRVNAATTVRRSKRFISHMKMVVLCCRRLRLERDVPVAVVNVLNRLRDRIPVSAATSLRVCEGLSAPRLAGEELAIHQQR